jgi:hypothetical protein
MITTNLQRKISIARLAWRTIRLRRIIKTKKAEVFIIEHNLQHLISVFLISFSAALHEQRC